MLTEEQELLRETARSLFERECSHDLLRAALDDPHAADDLWSQHLSGWVEVAAGDLVDLTLFLIEHGRAVAPGRFFPSALFAQLLAATEHPEAGAAQRGEVSGTVAMAGPDGTWAAGPNEVLRFVPEVELVDRVAVVVDVGSGPVLAVVDAGEVMARRTDTLDLLRHVHDLDVPAGLTSSSLAVAVDPQVIAGVVEAMTVSVAAELIGVARWLLDAAVAYARERVQFDRPIGSFQGLQWMLVDAALELERADAAVAYAAMCVDADDPDRQRAVHGAKAQAGLAARHCAKTSMQVHGGIGYTWEHDLHLRLRRAWAGDAFMQPSAWHHDRLADLLFVAP